MVGNLKAAGVDVGAFSFAEAKPHLAIPDSLLFLIINEFFEKTSGIDIERDVWTDSHQIEPDTVFAVSFGRVLESVLQDLLHSRGSYIYGEFVDVVVQSRSASAELTRRSQTALARSSL